MGRILKKKGERVKGERGERRKGNGGKGEWEKGKSVGQEPRNE
jgi:hypothetical protein